MSKKIFTSLGLMSGTSMDGIDASIIKSNGEDGYEVVFDQYFKYDNKLYKELVDIRNKINTANDLKTNLIALSDIEKKITINRLCGTSIGIILVRKFNPM